MVDFTKLGTPAEQAARASRELRFREDQAKHAAMSDAELVKVTDYYLGNTAGGVLGVRWLPGDNVYDGVVVHVLIPELLKRLKRREAPPTQVGGACRMADSPRGSDRIPTCSRGTIGCAGKHDEHLAGALTHIYQTAMDESYAPRNRLQMIVCHVPDELRIPKEPSGSGLS